MGGWGKRIAALGLGCLLALVMLEGALRAIGFFGSRQSPAVAPFPRDRQGSSVILCIGDSFTVGSGADVPFSYPKQLEKLFADAGMRVSVVNRGISSINTTMMLERFAHEMDEVKPDLVIFLAGGANVWNLYGYGSHASPLRDLLYRCKTFKLCKLLARNLRQKGEEKLPLPIFSGLDDDTVYTKETMHWHILALECERHGKYAEAIEWRKKVVEKTPGIEDYTGIGKLYAQMGQREEARKYFRKAVELEPANEQMMSFFFHNFVHDASDKADMEFIRGFRGRNRAVGQILRLAAGKRQFRERLGEWIAADIGAMVREARSRGAAVVLMNYPNYEYGKLSFRDDADMVLVNGILRRFARDAGVPFVDNEWAFESMFLGGKERGDYFAPDQSHCNGRGYAVMAKNLYDLIMDNRLLQAQKGAPDR